MANIIKTGNIPKYRFTCKKCKTSAVYDSWDKADMAVNEFKEKHIRRGCIFDYDSGYASDFRFVTLIDSGDDLKYHASFMRLEVK